MVKKLKAKVLTQLLLTTVTHKCSCLMSPLNKASIESLCKWIFDNLNILLNVKLKNQLWSYLICDLGL